MDCFDDIIGLTRTPCNDYLEISDAYTTSDSGLYLDELIPLSKIESLLNCKVGENVFVFMQKAVNNAIVDFRIDATAILGQQSKLRRQPFNGQIGKVKRDSVLTNLVDGRYYGLVLKCNDIVSGELVINTIGMMFDTGVPMFFSIYDNVDGFLTNFVASTGSGNLVTQNVNVTLPLHSDYVENLEYYILYQYDGDTTPYNNVLYDALPTNAPKKSQTNKQFGYTDYLIASGVGIDDTSRIGHYNPPANKTCYGLTLNVSLRCKVEEIWCYDEMDYVGNPIDMAIAKAVRLKAASNLLRDIALSENLNFETIVGGETLGEWDERLTIEYSDVMNYIINNIDVSKTDCFECTGTLLGVGQILA
jgi:hypothetical protein